ncbi:hypothetical protein [Thiomicrorhabdus lithotrophica]|uniref:Uncharacterized protein n=1 Tax=Thiomicrorhabdus lithotrophica TaxID=2949997 RepID=A0ABY8CFK5_9GAMM|nr:hypothetical protein [Thiomicrorhabdus lithotrophica]WEJ63271.1 hypothetical protein NR989_03190 [Thiomicrorhabdus lithotrophica]
MINWAYFPQSNQPNEAIRAVVSVFEKHQADIDSATHDVQVSDDVLAKVADSLEEINFQVERGKRKDQKIHIPVLFGLNGVTEKAFEADAYHRENKIVIEVEAGRGVTNYQFLKDLFQACMMQDVDYLTIAIRNKYKSSKDFEKVFTFFDTLYKSNRLKLPLKGVLVIGY